MKYSIPILVFFLLNALAIHGEEINLPVKETPGERTFFLLPVATYSSDTGFGGGVSALKAYNTFQPRISTLRADVLYTQKKQFISYLGWDHYLNDGRDRVFVTLKYSKFPTNFYGMGNTTSGDRSEKYTPEYVRSLMYYERGFPGHIRIRGGVYFHNQSLIASEPGGLLNSPGIAWSGVRFDAGPVAAVLRDTRDNVLAARKGSLVKVEYRDMTFQNRGNSFSTTSGEVRIFVNPYADLIMGFMGAFETNSGDVPFYLLSKLGGDELLRGYEFERFRDRNMILFQDDLRFPITGPIGGALFAAAGRVASEFGDLFGGKYHASCGGGLRYYFNKKDRLLVRLDYARGSDSTGYYISFGEAF